MHDKRQTQRQLSLFNAIKATSYLSTGDVLSGSIEDLAPGGAKIVGETYGLTPGEIVETHLLFPLDGELHYRGSVAHVEVDAWGVEFMELLPPPMVRWTEASQFGRAELH